MVAGNGFNIKPSGKSWGKAKPVLKNIYVLFVMDEPVQLRFVCIAAIFTILIILTISSPVGHRTINVGDTG